MRARAMWSGLVFAVAPLFAAEAAWRRDAYVWQRLHGAEVAAALEANRERVTGFYPLAADVSWVRGRAGEGDAGGARIFRVALDHAALAAPGRPVGLVLRIGPFAGPFARDDETARRLAELARELLVGARRAGLEPAELQVDFDCAERTLGGYREWLLALREAAQGTPLVFTALPAWLRHEAEFAALAAAADGFVLQVHSLEKPAGGPEAVYSLCNYERSLAWAGEAARIGGGRPFRVALPTYGYRLAFDARGEFFALSAEGPAPAWPADTRVRTVRTDPAEMSRIERALAARPPAGCAGVIWFRLPVAGDRLNWSEVTFARVLAGEEPRAGLETELVWTESRLAEIVVVNRGETTEPLPAWVVASWAGTERLVASDGLGGYEILGGGQARAVELRGDPKIAETMLAPGKKRRIGWLRFSDETALEITFPEAASSSRP